MSNNQGDVNDPASVNNGGSENLTFAEFGQRRLGQPAEIPEETPPEVPTTEIPEEEVEGEASEPVVEPTEDNGIVDELEVDAETESVLSQLNLEDLSEQEIDKLRDELKSKAVGRYGELTAKRKAAEEEAMRLRAELTALKENKNPLEKEAKVENNPFSDIESVEALQKEYETFGQTIEWADDLLDENEHSSLDDIITEIDGKDYTKRQVKDYMKKARQAREKFLPARFKELQVSEQAKHIQVAMQQKAEAELPWLKEDEGEMKREYDAVMADPRVASIIEKVPEVAPQLGYLLAHSVNSFLSAQKKQPATKASPKPAVPKAAPPHNPSSSTARGVERGDTDFKKHLKELENRFTQTHSTGDYTRIREAQIAKRLSR